MNELARIEEPARTIVRLSNDQLRFIANTEFVPGTIRGRLPAIMACVATGRALGIDDMSALRTIHVIDGRPSLSAELMVMLVRRAGHSIEGETSDSRAVAIGRRVDNGDTITVEWTLAMAERAGLTTKKGATWARYPEAMLWARAVSQLCRMLFADVFAGGMTYVPEEVAAIDSEAEHVDDHLDVVHVDELDEADLPEALRSPPADDPTWITPKQRGRLWTIAKGKDVPEEELRDIVEAHTGQRSTHPIPRGPVYDLIVDDVHAWRPYQIDDPESREALGLPIPSDVARQLAEDAERAMNDAD